MAVHKTVFVILAGFWLLFALLHIGQIYNELCLLALSAAWPLSKLAASFGIGMVRKWASVLIDAIFLALPIYSASLAIPSALTCISVGILLTIIALFFEVWTYITVRRITSLLPSLVPIVFSYESGPWAGIACRSIYSLL